MKKRNHNRAVRGFFICTVILLLTLIILLTMPAKAYNGERITTARQDALHQAADLLRAAGYADDSEPIKALSAEWWAEQAKLDAISKAPLSRELQAALIGICDDTGVDPFLALGLIETESGFNVDIVSKWGDYGLCQLNYLYFPTDLTPTENMAAGIGLLASNIKRYNGDVTAALTAYNRGYDDGSRWYASAVLSKAAAWGYRDG